MENQQSKSTKVNVTPVRLSASHWQRLADGAVVTPETPEQFWAAAVNYFSWCDNNPLGTRETSYGAGGNVKSIYKREYARPYTLTGLCIHCGVTEKWINEIRNNMTQESLWYQVIEKVIFVIYTQNVEYSIVGMFDKNLSQKQIDALKPDNQETPIRIEVKGSKSMKIATSENEVDLAKRI